MVSRDDSRVQELADRSRRLVYRRADRLFAGLLVFQWIAGIVLAAWSSPWTWVGAQRSVHPHLIAAVVLGSVIIALPLWLALFRPGRTLTRHVVAVGQMLQSALLIHLTGGRIETHFHVFGSLAFLAFYRDWRVLITATAVVTADHALRGLFWPHSVFGTPEGAHWRWVEHAGWVVFEDLFLIYACIHGSRDLQVAAERQVELERARDTVEEQVLSRTRELVESEERCRALLEQGADFITVLDADGIVLYQSPSIESLGLSAEQVRGRNFWEFANHDDRATIAAQVARARETGALVPFEFRFLRPDGFWRNLEGGGRYVPGLYANGALVLNTRDVTERRRYEDGLRRAKIAADEASRAKSEFLANMSHEIRTPMNGILGLTDLLLDGELSADHRETLTLVKSSADALLVVINDILDFSKIEAGKLDLDPIDFALRDVVGDTLKALALRAHSKGLELACDIQDDVPEDLLGDSGRLRQILTNLVGNAIKFTDRGEVVIRVEQVPGAGELRLRFTVMDTGVGIAPDRLSAIFQPFTQADGSTTRRYGGTGLGLTISTRLVELMGGTLWVESELGKGSRFSFEIQVGRALQPCAPSPGSSPLDLTGRSILVVDDNATNRLVLEETVRHRGAVSRGAASGPEGIAELRRAAEAGTPYALLLLDAMMPDMDGFMVAEEVTRDSALRGTPIIMLTSADRSGDAARCRELGLASYLVKPAKSAELYRAMRAALDLEQTPLPAAAGNGSQVTLRALRVLLAEDNSVNQRVAIRLLEKHGHSVVVASDGQEALSLLSRDTFDLVLMDVQMPVMDGLEATQRWRLEERATGRHVPIVAMTAHVMKGDRERCLQAGMDDYISKPVQKAELDRVLREVITGAATTPAATASSENSTNAVLDSSALERLGGDLELYREISQLFCTDSQKWTDEIQQAVSMGDLGSLRRSVHALKGAAGYVGGSGVVSVASRIEHMAEQGELVPACSAVSELTREMDRLVAALSHSTSLSS